MSILYCKNASGDNPVMYVHGKNVNLRSKPTIESDSLGFLQNGAKVRILKTLENEESIKKIKGHWNEVIVLSGKMILKKGWVFSPFLIENLVTPETIFYKLEEEESQFSDSENLKKYQEFAKKYPNYQEEDIGLYSIQEILENKLEILKCWENKSKKGYAYLTEELVKNSMLLAIKDLNVDLLAQITSCQFYIDCESDVLPRPFSNSEIKKLILQNPKIQAFKNTESSCSSFPENSIETCFTISTHSNSYYISNICNL